MIPLLVLLASPAQAMRPTDGGLFAYDSADVVTTWDAPGGRIRVHYAIEGPSTAVLDDDDDDGVPDYVEGVAAHVDAAWATFEAQGFRPPLREADLGLGALGGSAAFDVYLLDFGGNADGAYRSDGCVDGVCAGYLTIENDFRGYGYPSLDEATATLASHELFHAVQAAYIDELDVWFSEGTATWAQRLYDPDNRDFLRYAEVYLADAGRSLDKPPAGPVPPFAYSTALWFDYLTLRHDADVVVQLLEDLGETGGDPLDAIGAVLSDRGDGWEQAFSEFGTWNLATGSRAGGLATDGYPYAETLAPGVRPAGFEATFVDDPRVFPVATEYVAIEHPGGPLWVGPASCGDPLPQVVVHPAPDGVVGDALDRLDDVGRSVADGSSLEAGRYYLVLSQPRPGGQSIKTALCAGAPDALPASCELDCEEEPEDTDPPDPDDPGCAGCSGAGPSGMWAWWLGALIVLGARRRVPGPTRH